MRSGRSWHADAATSHPLPDDQASRLEEPPPPLPSARQAAAGKMGRHAAPLFRRSPRLRGDDRRGGARARGQARARRNAPTARDETAGERAGRHGRRVVAAIEDKKVALSLFVSLSPLAPQRPLLLAAPFLPSAFDLATVLDQDHRHVPLLLVPAQVSAAFSICTRSYLLVPARTNHNVPPDTGVGNAPPRCCTRAVQRRRDQGFPAWPAFLCIVYLLCMYYPCCGRHSGRPGVPSIGPCAHAMVNTMSLAPTLLLSCSWHSTSIRSFSGEPPETDVQHFSRMMV